MTSKLSWIAFAPFTLAAFAVKVIQLMFLDKNGTFMGLTSLQLSYIALGCVLAIFLFAVIFCLCDRKTAPVYVLDKNIFAGIFGLMTSALLACDGANRAFNMIRMMTFGFVEVADVVCTIFCAIVFVVMGLNHFVGNGGVRGMALFYLIPSLWGALRLVSCFLQFTTVSVVVTDVSILGCYIFATLFLFYYAMIVALMKGKNPVKSSIVYGLPAVAMLLSFGAYEVANSLMFVPNFKFFRSIESFEFLALGLYIFAVLIEISAKVRRKDEIEYVESSNDDEEYKDVTSADSDIMEALNNSVTYGNSPDKPVPLNADLYDKEHLSVDDQLLIDVVQTSIAESDTTIDDDETSDFIYGTVPDDDDFIMPDDSNNDDGIEITEDIDDYVTKEEAIFDDADETKEETVESNMDRIDRLILEISEENKK